jgi:hypothetical protein
MAICCLVAEECLQPDEPGHHDDWEQAGGFVDGDDDPAEEGQHLSLTAATDVEVTALDEDDDPPNCQQPPAAGANPQNPDMSAEVQQLAEQAFALLVGRLLVCPVSLHDW